MLFEMINQATDAINELDVTNDAPEFARHAKKANPHILEDLNLRTTEHDNESTLLSLCTVQLGFIKAMKGMMIDPLIHALNDPRTPHPIRFAIASSLSYFVNPKDLIPDNTSGGYGFIDDYVILRAAHIEYMNLLGNTERAASSNQLINFSTLFMSPEVIPKIKNTVELLSTSIQMCNVLPEDVLIYMIDLYILNPIQASTQQPQAPEGFNVIPHVNFDRTEAGHWQVANGNMFFGTQAAIYNGEVIVFDNA